MAVTGLAVPQLPLVSLPVHSKDTDERYTPAWLFDALGLTFDLDPCSPEDFVSHVPARKRYTKQDDGLSQPWEGSVFVNPPYSAPAPWAERFVAHANGVWLGLWSNAKWLLPLIRACERVSVLQDLAFIHPVHANGRRVNWPIMLAVVGSPDYVAALDRLARVHPIAVLAPVSLLARTWQ